MGSKLGDKLSRNRSTYDRMAYSENGTGTDVELQQNKTTVWSEPRSSSQERMTKKDSTHIHITRLDDETPPGTGQAYNPNAIVVTKTFGSL